MIIFGLILIPFVSQSPGDGCGLHGAIVEGEEKMASPTKRSYRRVSAPCASMGPIGFDLPLQVWLCFCFLFTSLRAFSQSYLVILGHSRPEEYFRCCAPTSGKTEQMNLHASLASVSLRPTFPCFHYFCCCLEMNLWHFLYLLIISTLLSMRHSLALALVHSFLPH